MCWHVDHWYGYKYDTKNFPDMRGFQNWAESQHIKTGFNHHSGCIYKDDPKVREFCRRAGLDYDKSIVDGPSFEPEIRVVQYDTRNERHFKSFYDLYLAEMIDDGFDFHWVDGANSIYSAELYHRYLSEGTGKRPLVLNRQQNYTLCNHRYPAGFSGDTYATWATMRRTVEVTLKGGNNGVWWSHDHRRLHAPGHGRIHPRRRNVRPLGPARSLLAADALPRQEGPLLASRTDLSRRLGRRFASAVGMGTDRIGINPQFGPPARSTQPLHLYPDACRPRHGRPPLPRHVPRLARAGRSLPFRPVSLRRSVPRRPDHASFGRRTARE